MYPLPFFACWTLYQASEGVCPEFLSIMNAPNYNKTIRRAVLWSNRTGLITSISIRLNKKGWKSNLTTDIICTIVWGYHASTWDYTTQQILGGSTAITITFWRRITSLLFTETRTFTSRTCSACVWRSCGCLGWARWWWFRGTWCWAQWWCLSWLSVADVERKDKQVCE